MRNLRSVVAIERGELARGPGPGATDQGPRDLASRGVSPRPPRVPGDVKSSDPRGSKIHPAAWLGSAALLAVMLLAGGCQSYAVRGKVIEGPTPAVLLVSHEDERLEAPGLAGAIVNLTLDPNRLSAKDVGTDVSDLEGDFAIPVREFGAGLLEYDARIAARLNGYQSASRVTDLPGAFERVLIILAPGADAGRIDDGEGLLEETFRLSEPYLQE